MKLLLDTCAFLWLAARPSKLSPAATAAINDPAHELHLSDVSIWEIVLKHAAGKLPLPEAPRIWIPRQAAFFQLHSVQISSEALFRSGKLPPVHQDPFDLLLGSHALSDPHRLISPDAPFRDYEVSVASGEVQHTSAFRRWRPGLPGRSVSGSLNERLTDFRKKSDILHRV